MALPDFYQRSMEGVATVSVPAQLSQRSEDRPQWLSTDMAAVEGRECKKRGDVRRRNNLLNKSASPVPGVQVPNRPASREGGGGAMGDSGLAISQYEGARDDTLGSKECCPLQRGNSVR